MYAEINTSTLEVLLANGANTNHRTKVRTVLYVLLVLLLLNSKRALLGYWAPANLL